MKAGLASQAEAVQGLEESVGAQFAHVSERLDLVDGAIDSVHSGLGEVASVQKAGFVGIAAQNIASHAAMRAMGQHMGVDGMPELSQVHGASEPLALSSSASDVQVLQHPPRSASSPEVVMAASVDAVSAVSAVSPAGVTSPPSGTGAAASGSPSKPPGLEKPPLDGAAPKSPNRYRGSRGGKLSHAKSPGNKSSS
jgi:hypothetical protein